MSKLVARTSQGILNKFLRSNRVLLPQSIGLYTRGAIKQDLCPFCDSGHDNNVIMYRPKPNAAVTLLLNTYSCDTCNAIVQEDTLYPKMEDLFEEHALRAGTKASERIDGMIYDATFPSNAHLYYSHVNPDEAPFKLKQEHCFYCDSYLGYKSTQGFLQYEDISMVHIIPSGLEQFTIDGGNVKICKSCSLIINSKLTDSYVSHLLGFCGVDVCRKCGDQYFVGNTEIDSRNAAQTFGKHMCPECCYNTLADDQKLVTYEGEDLFKPYSKLVRDGDYKINRYYAQPCHYCSEPIGIDLTLHPEEVVNKFVSLQGHFTCDECMFRENAPIKVLKKSDINIRIYEINNKFYIKKTTNGGRVLNFHTSLSTDEALNYLLNEYDDKQLKLI